MSAYVVSKTHIDTLLTAGIELPKPHRTMLWDRNNRRVGPMQGLTPETADAVGRMLWRENHRSVNYRYSERTRTPRYTFESLPVARIDVARVAKAIDGYVYQSCEHPGWRASEASRFCDALREVLARRIPGYEAAGWAINDRDVFTRP